MKVSSPGWLAQSKDAMPENLMESNEVLQTYQGLGSSLQNGENNLSAQHVGMRTDGGRDRFRTYDFPSGKCGRTDADADGASVVAKLAVAEDVRPSLIGTGRRPRR